MMVYRILFTRQAENAFIALPRAARIRVAGALEKYADNPFLRHDVRKIRGCPADKPRYRLRVGEYRVTFRIIKDQMLICVVAVGKKKNLEY